ncbi:MAG: hypothetical protein ABI977_34290 [Acidobacteriota bacterium]
MKAVIPDESPRKIIGLSACSRELWRHRNILLLIVFCAISASPIFAQPGNKELPIVEKPRPRTSGDRIIIRTVPAQPTKGVLAVVLDPIINGQVVIKDAAGRVLAKQEADQDGQVEFQLQRGKTYQIEASSPGYGDASGKSKPLKSNEVVRLQLIPQFAKLVLTNLPTNAQVFIDEQPRGTADQTGVVTVNELKPGDHSLLVRHAEYNDYADSLKGFEAGDIANLPIRLTRVAKLTIQGPAGATVLINGAVQGKINADGAVRIDYELDRASECTISIELTGYQTSSLKEALTPGPRTIIFKLDPVVTSTGVSDFFDSLSQWNAPSTWKLEGDDRNRKLRVEGPEPGLLKDKIYRDIHEDSNFIIWLDDGKGATWVVRADKKGRNYYLFHLAGPKSTTHIPRRFYTYLVRDGGTPEPVSTPVPISMDLNQKTSYTINIKVTGYTIQHSITSFQKQRPQAKEEETQTDDLGIWTDTYETRDKFLYGTFGFRSLAGEIFYVDDLNLEPAKNK